MALSAQDRRIITLIEQDLKQDYPRWSRRYTRHHLRLDRPAYGRPSHRGRRLSVVAAFAAWVGLVCADAWGGPAIWLWIALTATIVAITMVAVHMRGHGHSCGSE